MQMTASMATMMGRELAGAMPVLPGELHDITIISAVGAVTEAAMVTPHCSPSTRLSVTLQLLGTEAQDTLPTLRVPATLMLVTTQQQMERGRHIYQQGMISTTTLLALTTRQHPWFSPPRCDHQGQAEAGGVLTRTHTGRLRRNNTGHLPRSSTGSRVVWS